MTIHDLRRALKAGPVFATISPRGEPSYTVPVTSARQSRGDILLTTTERDGSTRLRVVGRCNYYDNGDHIIETALDVTAIPVAEAHYEERREVCPRCGGTGIFIAHPNQGTGTACFKCHGERTITRRVRV
jgi:ribosomal protein S27AE